MHGILLSPETIDSIISQLLDRLKMFIDKLIQFSQPHMREWNNGRRRNRKNGSKMGESDTQNSTIGIGTDRGFIQSDWALIFMLRMGLMAVQMMGQSGKSLANIGNPKIECQSINSPPSFGHRRCLWCFGPKSVAGNSQPTSPQFHFLFIFANANWLIAWSSAWPCWIP